MSRKIPLLPIKSLVKSFQVVCEYTCRYSPVRTKQLCIARGEQIDERERKRKKKLKRERKKIVNAVSSLMKRFSNHDVALKKNKKQASKKK